MENATWLSPLLDNPFFTGLGLGTILAVVVYFRGILRCRELSKQAQQLREHLQIKLEIDASENQRRKEELEQLKQERDNLQITVQALNHKPGRKEIRQYFLYQTALDIMFEKAPGFAPAWQITLKEAEKLFEKSEKGVIPLLKRLMPTSPDKQAKEYGKISRVSLEDSPYSK